MTAHVPNRPAIDRRLAELPGYLRATLDVVQRALDTGAKADVATAGAQACSALRMLDEHFWLSLQPLPATGEGAAEVLLDEQRAVSHVLPVASHLLVLLGFRPPSEAEQLVADARQAFAAAVQNDDPAEFAQRRVRAQERVGALRERLCSLAGRLDKPAPESRRALLARAKRVIAAALLAVVPGTLASELDALVTLDDLRVPAAAVEHLEQLPEVERIAIQLLGISALEGSADLGE